jgi:hypothetical protein
MVHRAPWSRLLIVLSVLSCALLAGLPVAFLVAIPHPKLRGALGGIILAANLLTLGVAALFVIRGYVLEGGELRVRRLLWDTRVPLATLRSAYVDPEAMKASLRLFGNGGLFSISGLFRNRALGNYRAWATDPALAVVLRLDGRTVVVTPESPAVFLAELRGRFPGVLLEARGAGPAEAARPPGSR